MLQSKMLKQQNNQTKFEEELSNQEFWQEKDPEIKSLSYLQDYENLLVNSVYTNKPSKQYHDQSESCVSVLFLPSYLYHQPSLDIAIDEKSVNLLNCMYTIKYTIKNPAELIVSLQQFTDEAPILTSYKYLYSDPTEDYTIQDISAGILGAKYIFLAIQQPNRIVIKVLNLDLTLHFEYSKEIVSTKINEPYKSKSYNNREINDMDYSEPGFIYYLSRQLILRIDLMNKTVIEKVFEDEEEKSLIRLLPVTQSEFEYYFRNSKKESLIGYNNERENKLVLFVIFGNTIYQLNMHSLQIIRISKFDSVYKERYKWQPGYCLINVIPLKLKNRQRKEFSQWSFILLSSRKAFQLFDWKEKNLFKLEQGSSNYYSHHSLWTNYRFVYAEESTYILEYDFGRQHLHDLKIKKEKGFKNYTYCINSCYNKEYSPSEYFTDYFHFSRFCSPILYKGEITFPCLSTLNSFNHLSNMVIFNSFRKQALNQQTTFDKEMTINNRKIHNGFDYKYSIFEEENQIYFQLKRGEKKIPWTLQVYSKEQFNLIQDYYYGNYYYDDADYNQDKYETAKKLNSSNIQMTNILMFAKEIKDQERNIHYLPMIFQKDKDSNDTYFGIFDIKRQQMIEGSIHKIKYVSAMNTHYDGKTMQLVVVLSKKLDKRYDKYYNTHDYLYFYTLNLINYQFKFVNLHKFYLGDSSFPLFEHNGYLNIHNRDGDMLIQFNPRKKFEIVRIIYDFVDRTQISFVCQKFFIDEIFGEKEEYFKIQIAHKFELREEYKTVNAIINTLTNQMYIIDDNINYVQENNSETN